MASMSTANQTSTAGLVAAVFDPFVSPPTVTGAVAVAVAIVVANNDDNGDNDNDDKNDNKQL